jgi:hypothetical protein
MAELARQLHALGPGGASPTPLEHGGAQRGEVVGGDGDVDRSQTGSHREQLPGDLVPPRRHEHEGPRLGPADGGRCSIRRSARELPSDERLFEAGEIVQDERGRERRTEAHRDGVGREPEGTDAGADRRMAVEARRGVAPEGDRVAVLAGVTMHR